MPRSFAHEIGLLRTLTAHLEWRPLPLERFEQELLRREGLEHLRDRAGGTTSIRMPGRPAFAELTDRLLDRLPAMGRGTVYTDVQSELLGYIEAYVHRQPSSVGIQDAEDLVAHFEKWFAGKVSPRRVFVPCVISRTPAPRFEIGPVTFESVASVTTSDFYPHAAGEAALDRRGFDDLLQWMRERDADWLARVLVDGCERERGEQIAELAVDLVIVALQLAAPHLGTRTMARLDAVRGTSQKRTLSEAGGYHWAGWTRKQPGLAIGRGTLHDILQKAAPIFTAVGNVVRSFASGSFRVPVLERAWCDAAYWLHQALAEPIDTIAMAKLETALEVLVCSESTKRSQQRMRDILSAFFDLEPEDPVRPGSLMSAEQFARKVVQDRSRILHGTWSTLNARGFDRAGMEGFVISVLRTAVIGLDAYAHSACPADNIDGLLSWMRRRKAAPAP